MAAGDKGITARTVRKMLKEREAVERVVDTVKAVDTRVTTTTAREEATASTIRVDTLSRTVARALRAVLARMRLLMEKCRLPRSC
jgi:hypothetical protein